MWKRFLLGGIIFVLLLAVGFGIFLVIKFPLLPMFSPAAKVLAPVVNKIVPGTIPTPTPTLALPLMITKNGNLELLNDPVKGGKRVLSVSGLVERIYTQGYDEMSSIPDGQVVVEANYKGVRFKFYGSLPDIGLIDDRWGKYQSIGPKEFVATPTDPPVFVWCSVGFPLEESRIHKCKIMALKNTL